MEENFSFGYWLRRQRLARDLRQDELAAQLGIATISLRKLEADERRPSLQLIARLVDVFGLGEQERETLVRVARADLSPAALPLPRRAPDTDPPEAALAEEAAPPLPSGTVTFLFTDIAGSTRLWEQHPELMRANLAQHDALLRAAVARHGGAVVKGTGDGLLAAFARAADGLAAALAGQRALAAAEWGEGGPLRVRMALHTGVAELVDGDYFGPTLNRAARLLAAGHGGQLLLSLAAAELLRDQLPPEVGLRDLGAHQLKDLARPEQVFQATAPGLPADFPPLRTRDTRLHVLPAPPNPLIGREAELAELAALLAEPEVRLLTLLGPGGTGKTRLALQAARELADRFADGVCFVDLTPVRDAALVLPAIGRALGLQESQERTMAAAAADFLRGRELLLVLDNLEQVVDAAPKLAALLAEARRLRVLATSREALRLAAERLYLVPPLAVPAAGDDSLGAPATQLFLARARAGRGDLSLAGPAGAAIVEICRRLEGLPLALELAAARLRHLTPQALLERLVRPLDLLTGGARDLPTRQQTLRATIAWSYDLLGEAEQALFRRLGVFVGGWDLEAAEAVGGLGPETLDLLGGLIDKSLAGQRAGVGEEPRYTMLETIREYALERLAAADEGEETREHHAEHFMALAERARLDEYGPQYLYWLGRLEGEHANLRASLQTSVERGAYGRVALMCALLHWFWFYHAHFVEAAAWVELVLTRQQELPAVIRAYFLRECSYAIPGYERQIEGAETSLALYRELGDARGEAWALVVLGGLPFFRGDPERAREPAEACLPLARKLGDRALLGEALYNLGNIRMIDGEPDAARALFEEGLALSREMDSQQLVATMLGCLGEVCLAQGDYPQTEAYFSEGAAIRGVLGDRRGRAAHLSGAGDAALRQGALGRALSLQAESLALFVEIGWAQGVGWAHASLAELANRLGQHGRAAGFLGAEEAIRGAAGYDIWPTLRNRYDCAVADACAALGEEAFAAAWAAGKALSLEQATAEAQAWVAAAQLGLAEGRAREGKALPENLPY